MLYLQPKKLLQSPEQIYVQGSLRDFVIESPWMKRTKKKAKMQFCNDAFEIAWILNKGNYLLNLVETNLPNWSCANVERQITESL